MEVNDALVILLIVSLAGNIIQAFRAEGSVPKDVLGSVLDFAGRRAEQTPGTTDDELVNMLRKVADWITEQQQPPASG